MKYIPGFSFTVGQVEQKKGGSLLVMQSKKERIKGLCDDYFKFGRTYILYHVNHTNDGFRYTFLDGEKKFYTMDFQSITHGDSYISKLIGE